MLNVLLFVRPKPVFKAWVLFFCSTKAWSGWACHRVFKVSFGDEFNQSLERVILPSSLQSLAFGDRFNQSLERVTLPSSLQSLSFGFEFDQSLKRVSLPSSLQCLFFFFSFDRSLYSKLDFFFCSTKAWSGWACHRVFKASFGDEFNQSLERVILPSGLQCLNFCFSFNKSLERVRLPSSLFWVCVTYSRDSLNSKHKYRKKKACVPTRWPSWDA